MLKTITRITKKSIRCKCNVIHLYRKFKLDNTGDLVSGEGFTMEQNPIKPLGSTSK